MTKEPSLDSIGLKHQTDKSSAGHNYLNFYENFFLPIRYQTISFLEIGVLNGASLAMWKDFFPSAKIIGVDINPSVKKFERDRVTIELADQSNIEELTRLAVKHGPFDGQPEDTCEKLSQRL